MLIKIMGIFMLSLSSVFASPKAVLFDFGGVFTNEPKRELIVDFLRTAFNFSETEFNKVNEEKRKAVRSGSTDVEFWKTYAKTHKIPLSEDFEECFNEVMLQALNINHLTYEFARELKDSGITVALLSNIDARLADILKNMKLYELFEPCLLSCEIGIEKPNKKAYQIAMKELNLSAHDIIFVDDLEENIHSARELGIDAIHFRSISQLREELRSRIKL